MQQAAELSVAAPTIEAALDGRFMSGLKDQRVAAAKFFGSLGATAPTQQPVCAGLFQTSADVAMNCGAREPSLLSSSPLLLAGPGQAESLQPPLVLLQDHIKCRSPATEGPCGAQGIDKAELVKEVKQALYASKITSYAQGLNIIKAKSAEKDWGIDIGSMARIWKVCHIHRV